MAGVEVQTFVPAEPRKEVPGSWIVGACTHANHAVFWEVQAVLLQLVLLYTFSRSEAPLQKSWTGEGAFDPLKNLQVQDVKVETVGGKLAMGVRLKAIKQDARMARPEARGEGDWVWIGESEGCTNIVPWLQRFFSFFAGVERDRTSPFFVARDRQRGLLYAHGMADVRELWARTPGVSPALAKTCGLHGLRVAGNNGTTKSLGKDVARAQGGWASDQTQSRYDRFDMTEIVRIPGAIATSWSSREADFDFSAVRGADEDDARQPTPPPPLPPLYVPVERVVSPSLARSLRVVQPYAEGQGRSPALPAVAGAVRTEADVSRGRGNPGRRGRGRGRTTGFTALRTSGPVQSLPAVPSHVAAQRRDSASECLSLNRPVRANRLAGVDRLPAGLPGGWASEAGR
jgi:hypothetical protein